MRRATPGPRGWLVSTVSVVFLALGGCGGGPTETPSVSPPDIGTPCTNPAGCDFGDCASDSACGPGQICTYRSALSDGVRVAFPTVCVEALEGEPLGAACDRHGICATGYCHLGLCTRPCDTDCPEGFVCQASHEPLADGLSAPIHVCLPGTGLIEWDPSTWPAEYQTAIPMPERTASVSLHIEGGGSRDYPTLLTLQSEAGTTLYDDSALANRLKLYQQEASSDVMFPNTPRIVLDKTGAYFYSTGLNGSTSVTPRTKVIYKLALDGNVTSGTLALRIFILPLGGHPCGAMTAATAPEMLSSYLDVMGSIYARIGIALGGIEYVDLDRPDLARPSYGQLNAVWAASEGYPRGALNLFIVQTLGEAGVLGISGGIPGPLDNGTVHSGVILNWETRCMEAWAGGGIGEVMAHESGHFLGLFHTLEQDGSRDALDDTDTSRDNLMFWSASGGQTLTYGQGYVMRNHPVVK